MRNLWLHTFGVRSHLYASTWTVPRCSCPHYATLLFSAPWSRAEPALLRQCWPTIAPAVLPVVVLHGSRFPALACRPSIAGSTSSVLYKLSLKQMHRRFGASSSGTCRTASKTGHEGGKESTALLSRGGRRRREGVLAASAALAGPPVSVARPGPVSGHSLARLRTCATALVGRLLGALVQYATLLYSTTLPVFTCRAEPTVPVSPPEGLEADRAGQWQGLAAFSFFRGPRRSDLWLRVLALVHTRGRCTAPWRNRRCHLFCGARLVPLS